MIIIQTIEVVYSSLCEANGAFIGKLKEWLVDTDVNIKILPFHELTDEKKQYYHSLRENCFIDVFYNGDRIDCVPLNKDKIFKALNILENDTHVLNDIIVNDTIDNRNNNALSHIATDSEIRIEFPMEIRDFRELIQADKIEWLPITKESYMEEMSMCLCNYPFGNPPAKYHQNCINVKSKVFEAVFEMEEIAGIYAKYEDKVIGLLEVFPRELVKKYGYLTGKKGRDTDYLTVSCYEVAYGIPRIEMIDELMSHLSAIMGLLGRKYLEAIGVYSCREGFNPYWVYDKYGFIKIEDISTDIAVLRKSI